MKRLRWQLIIIFLTGMVVGVLLLGEQAKQVDSSDPEPVRGGVYTEGLVGSMLRLNPVLDFNNQVDQDVNRLVFSSLLKFDDQGIPYSDLAESWGYSQDGTIYNFSLRKDITWHDGSRFTSEDVLFTIELLREGEGVVPEDLRQFWSEVEVNALSEDFIQFQLPEAFAAFPDYLTFGVLPAHLLADMSFDQIIDADFNLHPVGTGPYKFEQLIVEEGSITGISLQLNKDYYNNPPYIEKIIFRYYPDNYSALLAYQEGLIDGIGEVSSDILHDVLIEEGLSLYTARRPELTMIFFNLNDPQVEFFQNVEIRKALLSAINRNRIVDQLLDGQAVISDSVILPGTWAYYDGIEPMAYDPDSAIDVLREEGYVIGAEGEDSVRQKDGLRFSFELIYPDEPEYEKLVFEIQQYWENLNIEVILEPLPYDEIINNRLQSRSFEAALVSLNLSETPDPDPYPFWDSAQSTGGQNYSQWDNRIASDNLEQARITTDITERERLYRNFQVIFNQEMPALPLYYSLYSYAVSTQVLDVKVGPIFNPADRFNYINEWNLLVVQPVEPEAQEISEE